MFFPPLNLFLISRYSNNFLRNNTLPLKYHFFIFRLQTLLYLLNTVCFLFSFLLFLPESLDFGEEGEHVVLAFVEEFYEVVDGLVGDFGAVLEEDEGLEEFAAGEV